MKKEQLEQMRSSKGFVAALDQSGGSTPKALKLYGVNEDEYKAMEFENKVEKKVGMDSKRDIYNINIKVINGKLYLREAE